MRRDRINRFIGIIIGIALGAALTGGKTIYTSPEMTKTSSPVQIDLDVTGCNDFVIDWNWSKNASGNWNARLCLADAGFYQ